ncbi:hypothetical protein B0H66DRAFT_607335 [Apodospora peruviana]|uniref:Uncharacterized protein n=1 Tax=Apodospora peruviana TaxID=516989 RepID=A0AAE0HWA1_9PEZI|nr:hypothetical protein B0H66DRAFT_607335 [Apodospora peruviana]
MRTGGGIAVTYYSPWWPHPPGQSPRRKLVEVAYDIKPMYTMLLGEALYLLIDEITQQLQVNSAALVGRTIQVQIFNDNFKLIKFLDGRSMPEPKFRQLMEPVMILIGHLAAQIRLLAVNVTLEFCWIPGHRHRVVPHNGADQLSKKARRDGSTYCSWRGGLDERP